MSPYPGHSWDSAPWALIRAVLLLQPSSAGAIATPPSKASGWFTGNRGVPISMQSQKHQAIKVTKFL